MARKGSSRPSIFGGYNHYDSQGRKVGTSRPNLFGGYTNYDNKGRKVGTSYNGFFGGVNHYDNKGRRVARTDPGLFGNTNTYNSKGKRIGHSEPSVFGGSNHYSGEGCYIATCAYGSYDCTEVLILRNFRDNYLRKSAWGNKFISIYYRISPKLVKWFGGICVIRDISRVGLNFIIKGLIHRGYIPEADR